MLCILNNLGYAHTHTYIQTNTEYVILIAFRRQTGFRERASVLRYTYTACLFLSLHCQISKYNISKSVMSYLLAMRATSRGEMLADQCINNTYIFYLLVCIISDDILLSVVPESEQ